MLPKLVSEACADPKSDKLATFEELAAVEFKPLEVGKDFLVLSKEEWARAYDDFYIVASNIAAKLLSFDKAKLVERAGKMMDELKEGKEEESVLHALRSTLNEAETFIKELTSPIGAAQSRLLCACCHVLLREEDAHA